MSIPLFAHDANVSIDGPLCHRTHGEIVELLRTGQVLVLRNARGKEWAVQFKRLLEHTLASQLSTFLADTPDLGDGQTADRLLELLNSSSEHSGSSISDRENRANVGEPPHGPGSDLSPVDILRAHIKIKAWPLIGDENAVRVGCK